MSLSVQERVRTRPWLVGAVAVGVFVLGIAVGVAIDGSRDGSWIEGRAQLGDNQVSIETDDWTYGVEASVPEWIDAQGTHHEGGWPACLDGPVGSTRNVRFIATPVRVEGVGFRAIVAVDCR